MYIFLVPTDVDISFIKHFNKKLTDYISEYLPEERLHTLILGNYNIDNVRKISKEEQIGPKALLKFVYCFILFDKCTKIPINQTRYWSVQFFNKNHFNNTNITIPLYLKINKKQKRANVIIIDMDDTFLDKNDKLMLDLDELVDFCKTKYTYVVLWTFSTYSRLYKVLEDKYINKFDLVLTRNHIPQTYTKGVGVVLNSLYRKFKHTNFGQITLLDDRKENCTQDYTYFILAPKEKASKRELLSLYKEAILLTLNKNG